MASVNVDGRRADDKIRLPKLPLPVVNEPEGQKAMSLGVGWHTKPKGKGHHPQAAQPFLTCLAFLSVLH